MGRPVEFKKHACGAAQFTQVKLKARQEVEVGCASQSIDQSINQLVSSGSKEQGLVPVIEIFEESKG